MPPSGTLALFLAAVVLFAVAPGPVVFYVVTRSLSQGRRSGITSALAVASGNLVHVAAAVVGLSALLASSAVAFTIIKYLGATYLSTWACARSCNDLRAIPAPRCRPCRCRVSTGKGSSSPS